MSTLVRWRPRHLAYAVSTYLVARLLLPSFILAYVRMRLRKRINWLNRHGHLAGELKLERVAPILLKLGLQQTMSILDSLHANAATVCDPTGYVLAAAQGASNGVDTDAQAAKSAITSGNDIQLRRAIWHINQSGVLVTQLRYDKIATALQALGVPRALALLKDLEDNAQVVREPTNYVLAGAKRIREGCDVNSRRCRDGDPSAASEADTKLRKRIGWINNNLPVHRPVMYCKLAPVLLRLEVPRAMEILKDFEEMSASVDDPTAWILAVAEEVVKDGSAAAVESARTSAANIGPEEKIWRRLSWLNERGNLQKPLIYDRVAPSLLQLGIARAMALLKELEVNAQAIQDPAEYILAAALKESGADV